LTHLLAHITGHKATKLIFNAGDQHIYADQLFLVPEQFARLPMSLPSQTIEFPEAIKELQDFIDLPLHELITLVKGYEE
ncbi:thymidylate synthase, partial [Streptococcus pyogenes]